MGTVYEQLTPEILSSQSFQGDSKYIHGGNFSQDKANIYSWLAWQYPPGRQLHQAVMQRILNPQHPKAQFFVNWFKDLYDLP